MEYSYVNYIDNDVQTIEQTVATSSTVAHYLVDYTKEQSSNVVTYNLSTHGNLYLSPHFCVSEFKSPDSNIVKIDNRLIWLLEKIYNDLSCSKIVINSGYRTNSQTIKDGGYYGDYHTLGKSIDFTAYNKDGSKINAETICCLIESYNCVYGIGYISPTAVHIDTRSINETHWLGDEYKGISLLRAGYKSFAEYFGNKLLTVKSGDWYIRNSASTSGKILAVVKGGTKLNFTTITSNGWAYVNYNGIKGYISNVGYTIS